MLLEMYFEHTYRFYVLHIMLRSEKETEAQNLYLIITLNSEYVMISARKGWVDPLYQYQICRTFIQSLQNSTTEQSANRTCLGSIGGHSVVLSATEWYWHNSEIIHRNENRFFTDLYKSKRKSVTNTKTGDTNNINRLKIFCP